VLLLFLLFFVILIKALFFIYANPLPDEAYYWLWSSNVAFSYFDHPPLAAWVQSLLFFFSNNKNFLIRALPLFSLGIMLTIMIFWQKCIFRKIDYREYLRSVVLFLTLPIFSIFFSISFPDYLLITLLFASSFFLFLYFEKKGVHHWYLATLLFSLALLTKYNAVLFGLGALAYILYYKKEIECPSYGQIIVSIFIVFLIQTPVLFWNLTNDFMSFSFHLNERLDEEKNFLTVFRNTTGFLVGVTLAFSPVLIFNLKNNFFLKRDGHSRKSFITMSKFVLVFSTIFCIVLSFFTNVLYYWLSPALVLLIPFLSDIIRSKMGQYLHISYGILVAIILFINMSIYPISAFFGDVDRETAILFGWNKIVEIVGKEKKERSIEKVVFSDYRLGSLYIFHSSDFKADVIMGERKTQFDVWRNKEALSLKNALIITDENFPINEKLLLSFKAIEFVRDIEIYIGHKFIKKYQVFLGTNE